MKKNTSLNKKIELFERLAVYGDRQTFLKALAQSAALDPKLKQELENAYQSMVAAGVNDAHITAPLVDALHFDKYDPEAIKKSILSAATQVSSLQNEPQFMALMHSLGLSNQVSEKKQLAQPKTSNSNVLKIQNYLNQQLAVEKPVMAPITPDGIIGPETTKALKLWAQTFDAPVSNINDIYTMVLAKAVGQEASDQIATGPNYEEAKL